MVSAPGVSGRRPAPVCALLAVRCVAQPSASGRSRSHAKQPALGAAPAALLQVDGNSTRLILLEGRGGLDAAAAGAAVTTTAAPPLAAVLPGMLRSLFLPRGWPHSVTPDYLPYQLLTVPAHITGWISHSLATSSLLAAVGVGLGPAGAVGASAAIKWLTKDGLGAAGRLVVGGSRLAALFDEDPRRWRMAAEGITSVGLALEIATQLFPGSFVVLAGAGNLAKAVGKGLGRPCFRVVQTHFSGANRANIGDVAAKEEVWEVVGQLAGLAASVALLRALEGSGASGDAVVPLWSAIQGVHVGLRYAALRALRFPYPNAQRARLLAAAHVAGRGVPSVDDVGAEERMLLPPAGGLPRVALGCTLAEAAAAHAAWARAGGAAASSSSSSSASSRHGAAGTQEELQGGAARELVELYCARGERYVLGWDGGAAHVALWEDAVPLDLMRAHWQAAWLAAHGSGRRGRRGPPPASPRGAGAAAGAPLEVLQASLDALERQFPGFHMEAARQGWELERGVFPTLPPRLRHAP